MGERLVCCVFLMLSINLCKIFVAALVDEPVIHDEASVFEALSDADIDDILEKSGFDFTQTPRGPGPEGQEGPTVVNTSFEITRIGAITPTSFDVEAALVLTWRDFRFVAAFAMDNISVPSHLMPSYRFSGERMEEIWRPPLFFPSASSADMQDVTTKNHMLTVENGTKMVYGARVILTVACLLKLQDMPFDNQTCSIDISGVGLDTDRMVLQWSQPENESVHIEKGKLQLHEFYVTNVSASSKIIKIGGSRDGKQRYLQVWIEFKRELGYYMTETFLPSILILFINWLSFWLDIEQTAARVGLCVTTVLTMQTIQLGTNRSIQAVSYLKALDVWLLVCQTFVTSALAMFIINHNLYGTRGAPGQVRPENIYPAITDGMTKNPRLSKWADVAEKRKLAKRIDYFCKILYPILFLIFMLVYWCIYLTK